MFARTAVGIRNPRVIFRFEAQAVHPATNTVGMTTYTLRLRLWANAEAKALSHAVLDKSITYTPANFVLNNADDYLTHSANNMRVTVLSLTATRIELTLEALATVSCIGPSCLLDVDMGAYHIGSCTSGSATVYLSTLSTFNTGILQNWTPTRSCFGRRLRLSYPTSFSSIFVGNPNGNSMAMGQFMHVTIDFGTFTYMRYEGRELAWTPFVAVWQRLSVGIYYVEGKGHTSAPFLGLASSLTVRLLGLNADLENELEVRLATLSSAVGAQQGKALAFSFSGTATWATSPFPQASAPVECKCTTDSPVSATSVYTEPVCVHHILNSKHVVSVRVDAAANANLSCFFPAFRNPGVGQTVQVTAWAYSGDSFAASSITSMASNSLTASAASTLTAFTLS